LVILEPKQSMPYKELAYYAAYLNKGVRWRFSFGRMVTSERVKGILLPEYTSSIECPDIASVLPPRHGTSVSVEIGSYIYVPLTELFDIASGAIHSREKLRPGDVPLVSCSADNNGISGFYDVAEGMIHQDKLTVAYDGQPLTARYHPYRFSAYDNVGILTPKTNLRLPTVMFVAFQIEGQKWRYSYGRKCYREKLSRLRLAMPTRNGHNLDENAIERLVSGTSYWDYLRSQVMAIQEGGRRKGGLRPFVR